MSRALWHHTWMILFCVVFGSAAALPEQGTPWQEKSPEGSTLRIHFERTGGLAGLRMVATMDSAALSPEEARELAALVAGAGFFDLPAVMTETVPSADRFRYRLTVETPEQSHTVTVDEGAVPDALRPLLDWLTAAARQART